MLRSQAIRIAKTPSTRATSLTKAKRFRGYATETPHPEVPKAKSNSGLWIGGLIVAAGAGGYWYYNNNPDEVHALQAKAKRDEEEAVQKAGDAASAGKARADDAYRMAQLKFDEVKTSTDKTIHDAEARAKQAANDAQAKYEEYKQGASRSLSSARDSTENLYREAKESGEERKEKAKAGWFSWLGWGKSTAEDTKKAGAEKVADAAGDVQSKAGKHT
jgi:hypothetical protein